MRLGLHATRFAPGTQWSKIRALCSSSQLPLIDGSNKDGSRSLHPKSDDPDVVLERHRHRYEVNPAYAQQLDTLSNLKQTAYGLLGRTRKGLEWRFWKSRTILGSWACSSILNSSRVC